MESNNQYISIGTEIENKTAFLSPLSFLEIERDTLNESTVPQHL